MSNRSLLVAASVVACLVGTILFLDSAPSVLAQMEPTFDQQITGNSPMLGSPSAYTVVALPEGYKSDALSQEVLNSFAVDKACVDLKKKTELVTMTESHPLLKKEGPLNNVSGTYPMVCVMENDGKLLFKRSGRGCSNLGSQVASADNLRKLCPSCPDKPAPKPNKPDQPEVPAIPDTPSLPDTPETPLDETDNFLIFAALAGLVFATVRYFQE